MQSIETEVRAQAQRAKTCKVFEWTPGMLSLGKGGAGADDCPHRVVAVGGGWVSSVPHQAEGNITGPLENSNTFDRLPDLSDPGTQGCVIELVAHNNPRRSKSDALRDLAHAMSRGLNIEDALVYELESCAAEDS